MSDPIPYKLWLPWPPSKNAYRSPFAPTRKLKVGGRFVKIAAGPPYMHRTNAGKKYRDDVIEVVLSQAARWRLRCRLSVVINFVLPDRRKRDIHNYLEAPFDAMEHAGVYEDDSQFDVEVLRRGHVEPPGRLEITLFKIADVQLHFPGMKEPDQW